MNQTLVLILDDYDLYGSHKALNVVTSADDCYARSREILTPGERIMK